MAGPVFTAISDFYARATQILKRGPKANTHEAQLWVINNDGKPVRALMIMGIADRFISFDILDDEGEVVGFLLQSESQINACIRIVPLSGRSARAVGFSASDG